jgi:hypothetical protein
MKFGRCAVWAAKPRNSTIALAKKNVRLMKSSSFAAIFNWDTFRVMVIAW